MQLLPLKSAGLLLATALIGVGLPSIAVSAEADVQLPNPIESPLERQLMDAGFNPPATQNFVTQVRSAAQQNDRQALVKMVRFPFTTYDRGQPVITYHRPQALLRDFSLVFTPKVMKVLRQAEYERLFVNGQGAMLGNGEAWFDQRADGVKFKAINGIE